ncbi:MAG TPA: DNA repair protein RadA [Syntrophorhabdaceae bacterium]|nr:DNA repair protein RadA [Syntrophorhabdaceae bacterium]
MAKKMIFVCNTCGYETPKWLGKCPMCQGWDTFKEFEPVVKADGKERQKPVIISDEELADEERVTTGISEMDRVLGSGMTIGSAILLGGDPGIGKTTLCFDIAAKLTEGGSKVLYVSGEESLKQLASRKKRLGLKAGFAFLTTNHLDDIIAAITENRYGLVIVDSVQAIYNPKLPMLPGSMGQVKEVSTRLIMETKALDTSLIFIGHVTKEGVIAGPKILEHMVDTVLYFEGDKMLPYRILRTIKNRYGAVEEVGIFQMTKDGLVSVENPSQFFVSQRGDIGEGSSLFPCITGSRPIVLEVQAITQKTNFSIPKRLSLGYDVNRLFILISVIEKTVGKPFFDRDIYVNVTGGIKVGEPGIDLPVAASVLSSFKDVTLGQDTAFFGEIGLTGEIRKIVNMDLRIKECQRIGIKKVFCPRDVEHSDGMEIVSVRNLKELFHMIGKKD